MRQALEGKEEELGLLIEKRRSRRHPPTIVTDLDFADDIALISEQMHQAQEMISRVETETRKIGLYLNVKKTETMQFNQEVETPITGKNGGIIKVVNNFKYLGGSMQSTEKDFEMRKALAWPSCHKLKKVWKSNLNRKLKIRFFIATVESVLLYGSETWTINRTLQKRLDSCYKRMLRMALDISWKRKLTNEELYGELPPVSSKVAHWRMLLAGHCARHKEEEASKLVLWQTSQGRRSRGRKAVSYIDNLMKDTGLGNINELRTAMQDREGGKKRATSMRAKARPK